jgi:tetratricopeptide (TPR) repeat protein
MMKDRPELKKRLTCALLATALLIGCLSTSIAQVTGRYETIVQSGKGQLQAGDAGQALASGEKAIKLNPGRWEAYALAGGALMNLKRYEDAADRFSKAIDLAPETKQSGLRELRKQCALAEAGVAAPKSPATTPNEPNQVPVSPPATQAEVVLWKSIENGSNQSDFEGYLRQYPNGTFATLAQGRLDQLQADEKRRQEQQATQAAADQARQAAEAQRAYTAGVSYSDFGAPSSHISVSPEGFYYKKGNGELRVSCSDVQWKVEPQLHYLITVSDRSTRKKITFKPVEQNYDIHTSHHLADDLAANLARYCGAQGSVQ